MSIQLYNTATRRKEMFEPQKPKTVLMYTCGPTVYHFAHIGNFRTFVFEDLLRRTLKFFGYNVTQVMNLTDVDDKTLTGAIKKKVSLKEFTTPYVNAFFEDLKKLNVEPVEHYPAATDYIPQMIDLVKKLYEKGYAYEGGDGSIYYSISKFGRYGCLSHLHIEDLTPGASFRIVSDEYDKDNVADFVLWKKYDPARDGQVFWESPWGLGRPGWHIECSAMAMALLGETIDIHVGGVDNMFPHHENEIAQSEACTGKTFAKLWMHAEHLLVDQKKMSKSLGNFLTLRDIFDKGYTGIQARYMLMQTHYKTQLNFTFQGLDAVKVALQRLNAFVQRLLEVQKEGKGNEDDRLKMVLDKALKEFSEALADDLNISVAFAALFDLVREVNSLCDSGHVGAGGAQKVIDLLKRFNTVLGVLSFEHAAEEIPQHLHEALEKRLLARKNKDWKEADALRDYIIENGYVIEDTPSGGVRLKKG
jgi:cysteinyl-tRNA synthetase